MDNNLIKKMQFIAGIEQTGLQQKNDKIYSVKKPEKITESKNHKKPARRSLKEQKRELNHKKKLLESKAATFFSNTLDWVKKRSGAVSSQYIMYMIAELLEALQQKDASGAYMRILMNAIKKGNVNEIKDIVNNIQKKTTTVDRDFEGHEQKQATQQNQQGQTKVNQGSVQQGNQANN